MISLWSARFPGLWEVEFWQDCGMQFCLLALSLCLAFAEMQAVERATVLEVVVLYRGMCLFPLPLQNSFCGNKQAVINMSLQGTYLSLFLKGLTGERNCQAQREPSFLHQIQDRRCFCSINKGLCKPLRDSMTPIMVCLE